MATCPDCEFDEIETDDYEEGDTLTCPECGTTLSFLGADEVELLAVADDDDDDEEDDDDEDEDDEDDDDEDVLEVDEEKDQDE
jgi:hypothetical protein